MYLATWHIFKILHQTSNNYKFEPCTGRSPKEIQQCLDFWKFIEKRQDLFPARGFKLTTTCPPPPKRTSKEEDLTWNGILNLLKSKHLDKVANRGTKELCKVETCIEASERKEKHYLNFKTDPDECADDFTLNNLDDFDPQKVTYADASEQTDPVETSEKEMQTDIPASVLELNSHLKGLDNVLKEVADADLTGYFDCICDEPCAWLPYPLAVDSHEKCTTTSTSKRSKKQNQCTCSCGEMNCLCSLCAKILITIENARDSFDKLPSFVVDQCPCSETSCACLDDYRLLLDVKLEINRLVRETVNDSRAKFGVPMKCKCSCEQMNCPCKIVMKLFAELDNIMGNKEKPLYYYDKDLETTFGVGVCRCEAGENNDEERCVCLSFYKQNIEEKINNSSSANQTKTGTGSICSGDCMDECTLPTCAKINTALITDSDGSTCLCNDKECLSCTQTPSVSSMLMNINTYSDISMPKAPPNSFELSNLQAKLSQNTSASTN